MTMYYHVTNVKELEYLTTHAELCVVDFYAKWCGPCKTLSPKLEEAVLKDDVLAKKLLMPNEKQKNLTGSLVFIKVDVDVAEDLAQEFGITAMPTIHFIKNNKWMKSNTIKGANLNALLETIHNLLD